jgi:hypothetical protein
MMLKKIGLVAAVAAAGMVLFGGMASATESHGSYGHDGTTAGNSGLANQVGLVNLNNLDVLHNVNAVVGLCKDNINVLGVQVPVQDVADGLNIPILSPGQNEAVGTPDSCAAGAINDGGTDQSN